jgi:hypothetical protein
VSRRGVTEAIRRVGGDPTKLPLVDGPLVPEYDVRELARALDQEIVRAAESGWTKISLHMDVRDAMLLARDLRRL